MSLLRLSFPVLIIVLLVSGCAGPDDDGVISPLYGFTLYCEVLGTGEMARPTA